MSTELAWAAGFFDGEGYAGVERQKGTKKHHDFRYLVLVVSQVEREPLERFMTAVGVGHIYGPYARKKITHRPTSRWTARNFQARAAVKLLWPYLSTPKKRQIQRAVREVNSHNADKSASRSKTTLVRS